MGFMVFGESGSVRFVWVEEIKREIRRRKEGEGVYGEKLIYYSKRNAEMRYLFDPPAVLKMVYSGYYWNTTNNEILLTFDDGPTEYTEKILNLLNKMNIKGVFFCVGNNVQKEPSLTREILSEGHLIGNHTFNHKKLNKISVSEAITEINSFNRLLYDIHGYEVKYFRPPHGIITFSLPKILKETGLKNVMWSLLTYDYENDMRKVGKGVKKYLKKNSIVVLHDSRKSSGIIKECINLIYDEAEEKGLKMGVPAECLR
jgi:peptidoglycan-N-acetylglucosamine deacetylase